MQSLLCTSRAWNLVPNGKTVHAWTVHLWGSGVWCIFFKKAIIAIIILRKLVIKSGKKKNFSVKSCYPNCVFWWVAREKTFMRAGS